MESPRRRRGRPVLDESQRRTRVAKTRLNEAERAKLDEALDAAGITEAELLRRLSLEWATSATSRAPMLAAAS